MKTVSILIITIIYLCLPACVSAQVPGIINVDTTYATLTGITGPATNDNQVTVTDLSAVEPQKFYRIKITLP
jgi:hypothetical protein